MRLGALQPTLTWAEDRALLGSNPSADPGAKTGVGAGRACSAPLPALIAGVFRDWHESEKPSRQEPRNPGHDAVPSSLAPARENSSSR
jgi:hypothetical protein